MEFTEEDVCKLFDDEETTNNNTTKNNDITILFSINDKTINGGLARIECLPNGFNVNGKRSPSNTTHNVFVSDQLKVQLFKPLDIDGSSLVCQLFINETLHTEKAFNELHECNLTIPRCNKGGSNGKSRIGYLKLVQKQGEQVKLVGLSNNFWIRTKTRKETVTNDKKTTEDKKLKKREYEEDSESSYSSDSKRKKQPAIDINIIPAQDQTNLFEENQGLKKRVAELEKLVSDILTGKLQFDQNSIPSALTQQIPSTMSQLTKITKPRPSPLSVPLLTSNTFGMCSPTNLMASSCSSPGLDISPTFFITSPPRTGFENIDYPSNYSFEDMSDFF
ncbi:predicted protein [Naegleria gruberi]|uniref:Predicted protein n=1 Tax=Naegleria gruberi TaxID=5762 RepID=D2V1P4_NAEGR|nr:uncharacterized protein NAEGRDRAFT_62647 [Naegleria gruberi]EFC49346.1 predicted protein [Naegleria gruberi]|eukprot:XP_002682090.1 predicted protein [Naegleria gruberi strain NEG-M]